YAAESRGWVCDVCEGGRSNEEVLGEWREVCRAKGVAVEDEDENGGPREEGAATDESRQGDGAAAAALEAEPAHTGAETASSRQESRAPSSTTLVDAAPSSPQVSSLSSAPAPTPTRTTPVQTTSRPATAQSTSSDAPWLDRAILGVLIALAFMIIRRMAKSEEY
ncbi:uncharacterized protein CDV56_103411, partial [Aspergillus thermomutatus]